MDDTYYRIGEVSQVTGISKDTLHFYNKIGLLVPDHIDPDNQYRSTHSEICGSWISLQPAESWISRWRR